MSLTYLTLQITSPHRRSQGSFSLFETKKFSVHEAGNVTWLTHFTPTRNETIIYALWILCTLNVQVCKSREKIYFFTSLNKMNSRSSIVGKLNFRSFTGQGLGLNVHRCSVSRNRFYWNMSSITGCYMNYIARYEVNF